MNNILLEVRGLTKSFGALLASDDIDLEVREGETHAIIGPNGAGKTTLISQLAGNLLPDRGRVRFAGEDITALSAPARSHRGFARSFQITSIYRDFTALENVMLAVQAQAGSSFRFWSPARAERALQQPARRVLEEALAAAGFVFEVTRVTTIEEEVEIRHWRVDTRQGPRSFQTRLDAWPRVLPHGGLLIRDVAGDLYHLADPGALDPQSRALLWAFVD